MNPLSVSPEPPPVAAWVGLDWADQQHVICLYEVATGQSTITCLEQKPETLQDWLSQLRQRFGGVPVAIVLEQVRGAVIYALAERRLCAVVSSQSPIAGQLPQGVCSQRGQE